MPAEAYCKSRATFQKNFSVFRCAILFSFACWVLFLQVPRLLKSKCALRVVIITGVVEILFLQCPSFKTLGLFFYNITLLNYGHAFLETF